MVRTKSKEPINAGRIRMLMAQKGLSNESLAAMTYYGESTVRVAIRKGEMTDEMIVAVAEALGVEVREITA